MGVFSNFQDGFRSSGLTADLLTVVSDRIARAFNRSGATITVTLNISRIFNSVSHAGILHKRKPYEIFGQLFCLILPFPSSGWLEVVLDVNSFREYPVNDGLP